MQLLIQLSEKLDLFLLSGLERSSGSTHVAHNPAHKGVYIADVGLYSVQCTANYGWYVPVANKVVYLAHKGL